MALENRRERQTQLAGQRAAGMRFRLRGPDAALSSWPRRADRFLAGNAPRKSVTACYSSPRTMIILSMKAAALELVDADRDP